MKQIYDFERYNPPMLTEAMLRAEAERRRLHGQTALLALAALLLQTAAILLGYSAIDWYPLVSMICFGYVAISATGFGAITVIHSRKGGWTT